MYQGFCHSHSLETKTFFSGEPSDKNKLLRCVHQKQFSTGAIRPASIGRMTLEPLTLEKNKPVIELHSFCSHRMRVLPDVLTAKKCNCVYPMKNVLLLSHWESFL